MTTSRGSMPSSEWAAFARLLSGHGVAAVVLRDGEVCWANEQALRSVVDPVDPEDTVRDADELLGRLRRGLTVEPGTDGRATGEERRATVELVTNRALLRRDAVVTAVDDADTVLVSFSALAVEDTDPAHVERLETMLESTSDIIAVVDRAGRVRYANAAGRRLTGLTGQDVNGRSITDLVHPDDAEVVMGRFMAAVSGEDVGVFEARLRFADGTYHPVEAEFAAEVEVDESSGYVVTVRDVTERVRRRAEQQSARRRLEALVENLDDVIVVLAGDLSVQWASPGIERLIDAPAYTNVGENAFNDMHPDDIVEVLERLQDLSAEAGKRGRVEFRLKHAQRGWRWVEALVVNLLEDPDIGGLVCTLRDITERRDVDAELHRLHEQDRKEVARLREADRLKDLFLATVSHELRTPLSSVRGFSAVLNRPGVDLDDDSRRDMIRRIHVNALEMERMIEQLLELSRLQAGRVELDLETVPLEDAVGELLEQLSHHLEEHEVVTDLRGLSVHADRHALGYVLRNLLTNAAKYSEAGTRIDVEAERDGDVVIVRVRDQGIGIAPEDEGRIFQSFYQVDTGTTGRRGTGIGLNIARRYAQLLSGRLRVSSEVGVGSTFSVTLPASGPEAASDSG